MRLEYVNPQSFIGINELHERLALGRLRMNVPDQETLCQCSGNGSERFDNEIHIVKIMSVLYMVLSDQMSLYGKPACKGEFVNIMKPELLLDSEHSHRIGRS